MLLKTCSSVLFLLSVNYAFVRGLSADQKSRFAFVIDNTYSMTEDIAAVKSKTKLIFDTVRQSAESHIENFILVTFNDPDFEPALITNSEGVFKRALDAIVVHSRPDNLECPEMALHGVAEALEHTLPGSYIYVFTDAAAKDYTYGPKIKKLAQKQGTQISFVLTPSRCENYNKSSPNYIVYKELAAATTGLVLHVTRNEVEKVLDVVSRSLDKRRGLIHAASFPPGYNNKMTFPGDKEIHDVQVSVTGSNPKLTIMKPDGKEATTTDMFKNDNTLIVGMNSIGSGTHTANVGSETDTDVVITGVTNVNFQHGFSEFKPRSITATVARPILGKPSYLAIELSSKANDIKLDAVELLDMNDNVISVRPLKEVVKNFYVAEQQQPPTSMFKVAVKGHNTNTNESLRRLSATPIEPQSLLATEDKPQNRRPAVTMSGDLIMLVDYGDSVQLACKVNGYPKPKVIWIEEKSKLIVSEMIAVTEPPYDFVSILDLEQVKTNTSYQCRADNDYGEDATKVIVAVNKVPPKIDDSVKKVSVVLKQSATITCEVTEGSPQPHIQWSYKRPLTRDFVPLGDSSHVIQINSTNRHHAGMYKCEARNEFGRAEHQIELIVKYPPTIRDKTNIMPAKEGKRFFLTCNADAVPEPVIKWYFKGNEIKKTLRTRFYTHNTLSMPFTLNNSGTYTCNAVNEVGSDTKVVTVILDGPPFIETSSVPKTMIAVSGDLVVNLPCHALGNPKPTITWAKNGINIPAGNNSYNVKEDGTLQIRDVSAASQGKYRCTARNSKGEATDYFEVQVRPYPYGTVTPSVVNILTGTSAKIECDVPHTATDRLIWYKDTNIVATGELYFNDVDIESSGLYTCRVSTPAGTAGSAATEVTVGFPPDFLELPQEQIHFVLNGEAYMSCLAAGEPNPTVTWSHNGRKLNITEMDFRVYMTLDDVGSYNCTVSNVYGTITRHFQISDSGCTLSGGHNRPVVSLEELRMYSDDTSTVSVANGEQVTIICENGFEQYPGTEIEAVCVHNSTVQIMGVDIIFSNMKCINNTTSN